MANRDVSGIIQARAGERLVFGLINPDNDGVYQLEYGFMPPTGQHVNETVWQPVRVNGNRVNLDANNYPLLYNVSASGMYRLRNMAGDDTRSVPVLIEQYRFADYQPVERTL